jgi:hypothetical protein
MFRSVTIFPTAVMRQLKMSLLERPALEAEAIKYGTLDVSRDPSESGTSHEAIF